MNENFEIINPYTLKPIGSFKYTTHEEAFKSLEEVYNARFSMKNLTPFERAEILNNLAQILKEKKSLFAKQITNEMGKTINDSLVEMDRAYNTILSSSIEARKLQGEVLNSDSYPPKRNRLGITVREPIGVVLAITPFNFPINLAVHKIGPAFAAGNTILFKPGPQNYLSGKMLYDACIEAGFPKNSIRMILPDIPVMNELISDSRIACINLTGGIATAKAISAKAGYKKLIFELGGNDPLIVCEDADIELAVKTAILHRFGTAGQRCTACKKLFIHEKIYNTFKTKLVEETKKLKIGDPLNLETFIGPVVHEKAAKEVEQRIQDAIKMGANLLFGGKRHQNIIEPTILENVPTNCDLIKEETFGPVLPLISFSNIDEVITQINESQFGLQAGVFTQNLNTIKYLFQKLEVGALAVNDGPGFRAEHFPFGGVKQSGIGREGVQYAIEEMTTIKTLIF
jgi:acyl-CoA reductase-like NAD-dependent aldehyde dehydrogenase